MWCWRFPFPAPVCTPSRAVFLTGHAARAGLPYVVFPTGSTTEIAFGRVLKPEAHSRIPSEEITLADLLKPLAMPPE